MSDQELHKKLDQILAKQSEIDARLADLTTEIEFIRRAISTIWEKFAKKKVEGFFSNLFAQKEEQEAGS